MSTTRPASVEAQRASTSRHADGTPIAVWVDGVGPPLVMVHGSLVDHTTFDSLVGELRR